MRLGDRTAEGYVFLLGTVFLLASPCFAPEGGYTRMTGFKAAAYAVLTLPYLLTVFLERPRLRGFFRAPERSLCLLWLLFCLVSALFSPWRRTAFLGGSRREGFLQLALYGLSFLLLSLRRPRRRRLLLGFAAGVLLTELVSLLQLGGLNVLGLYPPGMGWADANLRYPGAYLGTLGNAGQTGAVLTASSALFFLLLLWGEEEKRWFLLLPLFLGGWVLGEAELTAPLFALGLLMLMALFRCAVLGELSAWVCASALLAVSLLHRFLSPPAGLLLSALSLGAWLLLRLGPGKRRVRPLSVCLGVLLPLLLLLFVLTYEDWYTPLLEARRLLRGEITSEMGSGRVYIWRQVLTAAKERLFLGAGPDTLSLRGLPPYSYVSEAGREVTLSIDAAHSELLQTLVCCGLPAALCHLGLFLCAALRFFTESKGRRACAGAALAYALQALSGISMCASAPVFWVLLALSIPEGGDLPVQAPEPDRQK